MTYTCLHYSQTFETPVGLRQHISEKHQYEDINEVKETFQSSKVPSKEPGLWNEDFTMNEETGLWDEDFIKDEVVVIIATKINMIIKYKLIFDVKY